MSIKEHLEIAKKSLENEKARELSSIKDKVNREKIIPYNQEIDHKRDEALAVLQKQHNANILAEQEKFAQEKKSLIEAGEKKKNDNANLVIATETSLVSNKYDTEIAKLDEQISKLKE